MDCTLSSMGLSAAEGTSKIMAPGIAGVGEKQYPAVPAPGDTPTQMGLVFEHRADSPIISSNNIANLAAPIPSRFKLEKRLNLNYKKAKFSLMSKMYFDMPSLFLFIRFCPSLGITGALHL